MTGSVRRRRAQVPDRIVGDKVVLVRPDADEAVVLGGPAAVVWLALDRWSTEDDLLAAVADHHPEASPTDHRAALEHAIRTLAEQGLLEIEDGGGAG